MSFLYNCACLELLELSLQSVLMLLANGFARQITRFEDAISVQTQHGAMGNRWPSVLVWYYMLFQSYTITNWNHIIAANWGPDNLFKRTIPSVAWPLTPRSATNLPQDDLACGCRGYVHSHTHSPSLTHTHGFFLRVSHWAVSGFVVNLQI